jgi:hypothetical protein
MSIAILRSITFIKASDKLCAPIYREKALLTVEQGIQIVLGAVHHAQYLVWRAINDVTGQKRQRERAAMLCCECSVRGPFESWTWACHLPMFMGLSECGCRESGSLMRL